VRHHQTEFLRRYYETEFFDFESTRDYLQDIFTVSRMAAFAQLLPRSLSKQPWLDVGCGFGYGLQELHSRGAYPIVGVDLSSRFLTAAGARNSESETLSLCQGDALSLPFPSLSFEGVIGLEVIEHTQSFSCAVGEICRVARKYVILSFPTDYDWLYTRCHIVTNPFSDISIEDAVANHVGHISVPKLKSVISQLVSHGFEVETFTSLYSLIPPPFKLGFHYPALCSPLRLAYRLAVKVDHWIGQFRPLRGRGLSIVIRARRCAPYII